MSCTVATSTSWEQGLRAIIESTPPRENWPRVWYDEALDRLTVMLRGSNDRNTWSQEDALPGVDVLLLSYPALNENPFTGMTFSRGVQRIVCRFYQEKFGEQYGEYRIRHNERQILTTVACIFRAVLAQYEPTTLSVPYLDQINLMLENEPYLAVHIPL